MPVGVSIAVKLKMRPEECRRCRGEKDLSVDSDLFAICVYVPLFKGPFESRGKIREDVDGEMKYIFIRSP